jgi:hypothetical protein
MREKETRARIFLGCHSKFSFGLNHLSCRPPKRWCFRCERAAKQTLPLYAIWETSPFNSVSARRGWNLHIILILFATGARCESRIGFKVTHSPLLILRAVSQKPPEWVGWNFDFCSALRRSRALFCYQRERLSLQTWRGKCENHVWVCARCVYFARAAASKALCVVHKRGCAHKADRVNTHIIILVNSVCTSNL